MTKRKAIVAGSFVGDPLHHTINQLIEPEKNVRVAQHGELRSGSGCHNNLILVLCGKLRNRVLTRLPQSQVTRSHDEWSDDFKPHEL